MIHYYFHDQLRWAFGFENPNKAAALLAAALPLLWIGAGMAWERKGKWGRRAWVLVNSVLLWTGWWLLLKTGSRGGMLAALAGFAWIALYTWGRAGRVCWQRWGIGLAGVLVIGGLWIETRAAERMADAVVTHDASVVNRLDVWKGGLQMLAEVPQGVGRGNSGVFYQHWYQPLDATARYRTLVNSYLTFATERGLLLHALAWFPAIWLWVTAGAAPMEGRWTIAKTGFQASLLGGGVAGFFSTTLEDWHVWIPILMAMIGLAVMAWWQICRWPSPGMQITRLRQTIRQTVLVIFGGTVVIWVAGYGATRLHPLKVSLNADSLSLQCRHAAHCYQVLVDEAVLGEDYGKQLRELALSINASLEVPQHFSWKREEKCGIIATGDSVVDLHSVGKAPLLLIAPAEIDPKTARLLLAKPGGVALILPGFDEDGRGLFWEEQARQAAKPVHLKEIEGSGTNVEAAWTTIVEFLKALPEDLR